MTRAKNMNEISDETKSVIANDKVGQDQRSLGDLNNKKVPTICLLWKGWKNGTKLIGSALKSRVLRAFSGYIW